jgi:hypothetical protein
MNNKEKYASVLIETNREKFSIVNNKISKIFKEYYNLVDTYSYEINYIENSINSFKPKKKFKIKNFIDNQQLLIKELVNIINNLLLSIKLHSNKETNSKSKKSIKSIIEKNNTNINYLKNKISETTRQKNNNDNVVKLNSKNQIEENISFLNIKKKKKEIKINQYINKPKITENIIKNGLSSKNSTISNIISNSTKNKSFLNNSNSFLSDINNIVITNPIYKNYKKSVTSLQMKKANKIRLKLSNYNNKKKEVLNSSFQSNRSQRKEKMRKSSSYKSFEKIPISISANSISNMIYKSRSKSIVPLKISDFSLKKENMPYLTNNDTASEYKEKKNGILCIFSDNKVKSMKKHDLDGKFHITPHRMTKEVLSNSYNILNKFEKRRKKDVAVIGKNSKS